MPQKIRQLTERFLRVVPSQTALPCLNFPRRLMSQSECVFGPLGGGGGGGGKFPGGNFLGEDCD